ncbi:DNA recombination protein RmuC [Angelakisella massiliensis]|uniref:DNA recombination protein RmuC n=1 Tax=Angelakisella massiliensis TaxID=1871018 RepID=UPI000A3E56EE|nr:DNA recombination protein RmuC [Angelakisella massiliensis]
MTMTEQILLIALGILVLLTLALLALVIVLSSRVSALSNRDVLNKCEELRRELNEGQRGQRQELSEATRSAMEAVSRQSSVQMNQLERRFQSYAMENEQKLENIRLTVEKRLNLIRQDNTQQLDEIRAIVEQKLQKTLDDRMTQSFQLVNERLEQVYTGLGEMRTLAVGVGDLKKVLSNVKTRGILGEVQLGAILSDILAPEQYGVNVATKRGSRAVVEFAVRLPVQNGDPVWLPIDSKFPADAYNDLRDAADSGSPEAVQQAASVLQSRIRAFAKDIRDKYIDPPYTTDFAIMFLPFEGLYAEVVGRGMVEQLQRDYRVNVAGPSTMAALLNSLQMGFRTFAIQQRSGEVWQVLGAVKTEFDRFGAVLQSTRSRLEQAEQELDRLVGVRTRVIQKKLQQVTALEAGAARELLGEETEE